LSTQAPFLTPGAQAFLEQLSPADQQVLAQWPSEQLLPPGWVAWRSTAQHLGWMPEERAHAMQNLLADCHWDTTNTNNKRLLWNCDGWSSAQRSKAVQALLEQARTRGQLRGWRDEAFAFWHTGCRLPLPDQEAFLSVERSGFRHLGLMSHAVHINGFTKDGRLWCGRRAANKATDPGRLDNVTAGGLPAGETVLACALRELQEEAGLHLDARVLANAGTRRTTRAETEGWHDETLLVFNLTLADSVVPHNQDGEVQEFLCLTPKDVLRRVQDGEFTDDAAASLAQGLGLQSEQIA
jgi:8-oxo-dGTP pyrophosphatase MutT (NUDIX family)